MKSITNKSLKSDSDLQEVFSPAFADADAHNLSIAILPAQKLVTQIKIIIRLEILRAKKYCNDNLADFKTLIFLG